MIRARVAPFGAFGPFGTGTDRIATAAHRLRFTPLLVLALFGANGAAGVFDGALPPAILRDWGVSLGTLANGEVFRLFSAIFLSHDAGMALRQLAFALLVPGLYEWLYGGRRTVIVFFSTAILGALILFLALIWPAIAMGIEGVGSLAHRRDVGMSGGGFGILGALVAGTAWRGRVFAAGIAALALKLALWPDPLADGVHLVTFALGFAMATWWPGERVDPARPPRPPISR